MEDAYWSRYPTLARRHWWWRARNRLVLEAVGSMDLPEGASILDVGCADGYLLPRLDEFGRAWGLEPREDVVRGSARADRIEVGGLGPGFRPERRYDLVLMLDVLEHVDEPAAALEQVERILTPGGRLLLTVPAFRILWTRHDEVNDHRRRYRREGLVRLLRAAGWRTEGARYAFHALFFAKLAVRAAEAAGLAPWDPVPRIPPRLLNAALYRAHRVEERVLGPLDPPFGSSLMAVARRAARESDGKP